MPCMSCDKIYIGTGRSFNTWKTGTSKRMHKKKHEKDKRAETEKAQQVNSKLAITDHCKREKHFVDCNGVIRTETNKHQ